MTNVQLAQELKKFVTNAPSHCIALSYQLFGICFAKDLLGPGISLARVLVEAALPKSYQGEINKGIELSDYVTLNQDNLWFSL